MSDQELGPNQTEHSETISGVEIWRTTYHVDKVYMDQFGEDKAGVFYISFKNNGGHWGSTHVLAEPEGTAVALKHQNPETGELEPVENPEPFHFHAFALATVLIDYDASGELKGIEIVDLPRTASDWERIFKTPGEEDEDQDDE